MSKTNPTDQAGDELKTLLWWLYHQGMIEKERRTNDYRADDILITRVLGRILQHYLPKRDVAEAIGPDENTAVELEPGLGVYIESTAIVIRNKLRAELRHRLGLEQVSKEGVSDE